MYKLMLVDDQRIIMEGIVKLIQQMNLPFDQFVFAENWRCWRQRIRTR